MAEPNDSSQAEQRRLAALADRLSIQQRSNWFAGQRVLVEEYLRRHPELRQHDDLVFELIYSEVLVQEELGETVELDSYRDRFPQFAQRLQRQLELHRAFEAESSSSWLSSLLTGGSDETQGSGRPARPFEGTDRFSILRRLGSGGMGAVYAAYDSHWQQKVAIKVLHQTDAAAALRLKQEFRVLADLANPHLVQLFELFVTDDWMFFTMELVEGITFAEYCRSDTAAQSNSSVRADCVRDLLRRLAAALQVLHDAGKVHCDIKPSNVLVTSIGRVVLLDFGLTRLQAAAADPHSEDDVRGTVAYMAPELLTGSPASPASDWYSVGAMLYQLLTSRLPFEGDISQILVAKQHAAPPPPGKWARDLPSDLDELCQRLLRRDPAQRPTAEEIVRRLGSLPPSRTDLPPTGSTATAFFGGHRELELLWAGHQQAVQGQTAKVLLQGESGIGKTALLQHFLRQLAARDDVLVLSGRCYEQESVPFKGLDDLIDCLSSALHRLPASELARLMPPESPSLLRMFPVLGRVQSFAELSHGEDSVEDQQQLRQRAVGALRELLQRLSQGRTVVLAIDDLQWGDADSAAVLSELLGHRDSPPLLLIGCYREAADQPEEFLTELSTRASAEGFWTAELRLGTLPQQDAQALAQLHLDVPEESSAGLAEEVARAAAGNPFLIQQFAWSVSQQPSDQAEPIRLRAEDADGMLWSRLKKLSSATQQLLELVAVAGHPLRPTDAFLAIRFAEQDPQKVLRLLEVKRLIAFSSGSATEQIGPYHDRIREAILRHLSAEKKRHHHLNLALVLEDAEQPNPEHLAQHFAAADQPERAWKYAPMAAERASQALAFGRAAAFFRLALDTGCGDAVERRQVQRRLAESLATAGEGRKAAEAYLGLVPQADRTDSREFRRLAVEQYLWSGHFQSAQQPLRQLMAEEGVRLYRSPWRMLVQAARLEIRIRRRGLDLQLRSADQLSADELQQIDLYGMSVRLGGVYDYPIGVVAQKLHLLHALRAGEPERLVLALVYEVAFFGVGGQWARRRAERLLAVAQPLLQRPEAHYLGGLLPGMRGLMALAQGDWSGTLQHSRQAVNLLMHDPARLWGEIAAGQHYAMIAHFHLGQFAAMSEQVPQLLQGARQRGDRLASHWLGMSYPNAIWLFADEPQRAKAELERARAECPPQPYSLDQVYVAIAEMHRRLYEGDGPAAWEQVRQFWPRLRRSGGLRFPLFRVQMRFLRATAALLAGFQGHAPRSLLRVARREAGRLSRDAPLAQKLAILLNAQLAQLEGQDGRAANEFAQAADAFGTADMAFHAAVARLRYGEISCGDSGRTATLAAEKFFAQQGVRNPRRLAAMIVPVVPPSSAGLPN